MPASRLYHLDSCSANEAGGRVGSDPKSIVLRDDSGIVGIAGVTCIEKCLGNARASECVKMSTQWEVGKVEDAAVVLIIFGAAKDYVIRR